MTFLIFVLSALRRANHLLDEVIPGWVFFSVAFPPCLCLTLNFLSF